jgi:hypothetical protein
MLALLNFLLIITEYSSVFHVIALTAILYLPLCLALLKSKKWLRLVLFILPQVVVFCIALGLIYWQFHGQILKPGHVAPFVYHGNLNDISEIGAFVLRGFLSLLSGIAPQPWGGMFSDSYFYAMATLFSGQFISRYNPPSLRIYYFLYTVCCYRFFTWGIPFWRLCTSWYFNVPRNNPGFFFGDYNDLYRIS